MDAHKRPSLPTRQLGAALILSLILLMVMTLLGLSSMRSATLEEKMSNNMRDLDVAFEASESGLRAAEAWLSRQNIEPLAGSGFIYQPWEIPDLFSASHIWWTGGRNGVYAEAAIGSTSANLTEVNTQPRFVLENRGFLPDSLVRGFEEPTGRNVYRATARGTGITDVAQSIVQSTFVKRYN